MYTTWMCHEYCGWSCYSESVQLLDGDCPNETVHGFSLRILMMVGMTDHLHFLCRQSNRFVPDLRKER
jgi:hypothetical protein